MKRSDFSYFRSDKDFDSIFTVLRGKIPIFWSQTEDADDGEEASVSGSDQPLYGLLITRAEGHPGTYELCIHCYSGSDPATFDFGAKKKMVLEALGVKEVPKPD